jgi:hypothetical protein
LIPSYATGQINELTASLYYARLGYSIFLPLCPDTPVDFVAIRGTETIRVQVKSSSVLKARYVFVATAGAKGRRYGADDFDELFVVGPRHNWRIPWKDCRQQKSMVLGVVDANGDYTHNLRSDARRIDATSWRVNAN